MGQDAVSISMFSISPFTPIKRINVVVVKEN